MSSKSQRHNETEELQRIAKTCGNQAILMGDRNARCAPGDVKGNPRGKRMKVWAREHECDIRTPDEPSFKMTRGSSKPDLYVTKNVKLKELITACGVSNGNSVHYPVFASMFVSRDDTALPEKRCTPGKQHNNPRIVTVATQMFRPGLQKCLKHTQGCERTADVEAAYDSFKRAVLVL